MTSSDQPRPVRLARVVDQPMQLSVVEPHEPSKPSGLLERLGLKLAIFNQNLARTQEQLEQAAREAYELKGRLKGLIRNVEDAAARIKLADDQVAARKQLLAEREDPFLNAWGNSQIPSGPDYTQLLAIKASIEDFPRARERLVRLHVAAKKALADFEKKHDF